MGAAQLLPAALIDPQIQRHAGLQRFARMRKVHFPAAQKNRAAGFRLGHAEQHFQQLRPPRPQQSGNPQNFTGMQRKADILQPPTLRGCR